MDRHAQSDSTESYRPATVRLDGPPLGETSTLDLAMMGPIDLEDPDEIFVRNLYRELLGREPDLDGMAYHLDRLKEGLSHDTLMQGFLDSHELRLRNAQTNEVFVKNLYRELLDREADPLEVANEVSLLDAGLSRPALIQTILSSAEYQPSATCAAKLPPVLPTVIRAPRVSHSGRLTPQVEAPRPLNGPLLAIPLLPRTSVVWSGQGGALAVSLPTRLGQVERLLMVDLDGTPIEQGRVEFSAEGDRQVGIFTQPRAGYPERANVVAEMRNGQRARFALPRAE